MLPGGVLSSGQHRGQLLAWEGRECCRCGMWLVRDPAKRECCWCGMLLGGGKLPIWGAAGVGCSRGGDAADGRCSQCGMMSVGMLPVGMLLMTMLLMAMLLIDAIPARLRAGRGRQGEPAAAPGASSPAEQHHHHHHHHRHHQLHPPRRLGAGTRCRAPAGCSSRSCGRASSPSARCESHRAPDLRVPGSPWH